MTADVRRFAQDGGHKALCAELVHKVFTWFCAKRPVSFLFDILKLSCAKRARVLLTTQYGTVVKGRIQGFLTTIAVLFG